MDFLESKTRENLMRAFAGESQARNRYIFSAEKAKENKLEAIEMIFLFTAKQEEAHAKVFYDFLAESADKNINIDGNYPVDIHNDVAKLLRSAQHNEFQEYESDYKKFSEIAKEEGFLRISNVFKMIADVEKVHGERFENIADMLEKGELFVSKTQCEWMCLNCGYIHKGEKVPEKCPVCDHNKGYFIKLELAPFSK